MLLEDVLKEFIFDCQLRKLSERTIKSYKNNSLACFSYFEKEFGLVELEELSYKHIQQYLYYLPEKGLKESYGQVTINWTVFLR